jgi:hypothetical protein
LSVLEKEKVNSTGPIFWATITRLESFKKRKDGEKKEKTSGMIRTSLTRS